MRLSSSKEESSQDQGYLEEVSRQKKKVPRVKGLKWRKEQFGNVIFQKEPSKYTEYLNNTHIHLSG